MNNLRTVAVGVYTPTEETFLCDPDFKDTWEPSAANAIDAAPKPLVGRRWPLRIDMDAELEELIDGRDDEEFNRRHC